MTMLRTLGCCALLLFPIFVMATEFSYNVPVLTVRGTEGECSRLPFSFSKSDDKNPLRVMISDDTPAGSGASIRRSVWLAAITAAMQKNDVMNGTRISVEFSGMVDGPSAGGMLCLAILSALDGRDFPGDFAMTGTIMPDGTIGVVGNVASKIRGAASSGIKRVCIPAFLRFEKQPDGSDVDLFQEGKKLGIDMYPVENINEAYAVLHKLPKPQIVHGGERDICAISSETESELIKQYNRYNQKVLKSKESVTEEEQKEVFETFGAACLPDKANQAFRIGRLLSATKGIIDVDAFWCACAQNKNFLADIYKRYPALKTKPTDSSKYDYLAGIQELQKILQTSVRTNFTETDINKVKAERDKTGYSPDRDTMSEISAQLEPVNLRPTVEGFYRLFSSDQDIKNMDNDELEKALKREERKAFLLHLFVVYHDADRENRSSIAMTQKQIKANPQAKNVENLFYCAWLAVDNTLESEIIRPAADADSVRTKELYTDLASFDYHFSIYQAGMERAIFLHELTLNPQLLKNPQYHTIASMHMQVNLLTQACGILMKYGPEIAAVQTENGFEYENRDFLHYLIRTARTQALQNIQECQKLNIPCLAAIGYFENAEIARDDNTADKIHDVLEYYWEAGLTAKALVMSFK